MSLASTAMTHWPDQSTLSTLKPEDNPQDIENKSDILTIHYIAYGVIAKIIVAVGIFSNILNLIVLTRPKLKGVMYIYLLGLAVSNLCVLISAIPALSFMGDGRTTQHYAIAFFLAHLSLPVLNTFMAASVYIMICTTVNR
jgi:hypothetical protein